MASQSLQSRDIKVVGRKLEGMIMVKLPCGESRYFTPADARAIADRLVAASDFVTARDLTSKEF